MGILQWRPRWGNFTPQDLEAIANGAYSEVYGKARGSNPIDYRLGTNPIAFNSLAPRIDPAQLSKSEWAYIARLDSDYESPDSGIATGDVWQFIFQPVELNWSRNTDYRGASTLGAIAPYQSFAGMGAWQLELTAPVDVRYSDRRLDEYVAALFRFSEPKEGKLAPSPLIFSYGAQRLYCVLTRFSRRDRAWSRSGELLACDISITLLEIPRSQLITG